MIARARVWIAIAALVIANLGLDFGIVWMGRTFITLHLANVVAKSFLAVRVSQVLLLSCWLALGTWHWAGRLVVAAMFSFAISSIDLLFVLDPFAESGAHDQVVSDEQIIHSVICASWLLIVLLTTLAILLPLRRMGQWRISWRPVESDTARLQFSAADFLLWLAPLCGSLGLVHVMTSFRESLGPDVAYLFVLPLSLAPIVAVSAFAILMPQRSAAAVAAAVLVTLLLASGFAFAERYRLITLLWTATSTPALTRFQAHALFWWPIDEFGKYVLSMVVLVLNCLALRATGCRLVIPRRGAV